MTPPSPTPPSLTNDDYQVLFHNAPSSPLDLTLTRTTGTLPPGLHGTYYLIGPGAFHVGGEYVHPFDAHGYVRELRLDPATPTRFHLRAAFVKTRAYVDELAAGRLLYRGLGAFPTAWRNVVAYHGRNAANTCVAAWGGRLMALCEAGVPHEVDAASLETVGEYTFGGAVGRRRAVLAHTRVDTARGTLVACEYAMGRRVTYRMMEFDERHKMVFDTTYASELPNSYSHDFCITDDYYVILPMYVRMDLWQIFLTTVANRGSVFDAIAADPDRNSRIILIPRESGVAKGFAPAEFDVGRPCFSVHAANAFQDPATGNVILDACVMDDIKFGNEFGYTPDTPGRYDLSLSDGAARLHRFVVDPADPERKCASVCTVDEENVLDFPEVHPDREGRRCRYVYGCGHASRGVFQTVVKHDLETGKKTSWTCGPRQVVGEAIFVPCSGDGREGEGKEDDGFLLFQLYDAEVREVSLCVIDALDVGMGPVFAVHYGLALPYGFHGTWVPADSGGERLSSQGSECGVPILDSVQSSILRA